MFLGEAIWERGGRRFCSPELPPWISFRAGHSTQELPAPPSVLLAVVPGPLLDVRTLGSTLGLAINVLGHCGPAPLRAWASGPSLIFSCEGWTDQKGGLWSRRGLHRVFKIGNFVIERGKPQWSGLTRPHPHRAKLRPVAGQGLPPFHSWCEPQTNSTVFTRNSREIRLSGLAQTSSWRACTLTGPHMQKV